MYRRHFNNSEIQDQEPALVDKHRRSVQLFHIHLRTLLAAALCACDNSYIGFVLTPLYTRERLA